MCIFFFGVLRRFQHCTGHITTGSWKGRGNQYIQFARVVYCKLPTNSKQLPAFPLKAVTGIEPHPQRWEARVLPLYHRGPSLCALKSPINRKGAGNWLTRLSRSLCNIKTWWNIYITYSYSFMQRYFYSNCRQFCI